MTTTLTTIQLITIILSSSLLAAILTSLTSWFLQKDNYKRDYYKKILDKRLDAYSTVENIVGQLKIIVRLDSGHACPMFCAISKTDFDKFSISLASANYKSFWLSDKVGGKLTELNIYLLQEIDNHIDENFDEDKQLAQLGVQHRDKIQAYRNELTKLLYNDFSELHDIKNFIKGNRLPDTYILQPKSHRLQKQTNNDTTIHLE